MSEVALSIGGRVFRVACAPGEEERVGRLGALINEKLASMGNLSGHEAQNILFAALLLADQVHEGGDTVSRADDEIAQARAAAETAVGQLDELKAVLANRDAEFERAQTERQDIAHELATAQALIAELNERIGEHQSNEAALRERVDELTQEREALVSNNAPADASAAAGTPSAEHADLAPALESLAEMLEQCADKLERALPAP
ncbi:hypothetical protein GCM10011515_09240 [Tsuneonella deserti]|uniref:Cell division protein ZapA n=1 Tax=Tsuneonella deserti TaxID=2035528 RepID=A0ABQ1S782_9SPHN|nr:cell division protein ZapA [Tsuneonella deserti]GGD91722.1 hypothetical protein GCM10011515_09240 [Tsuneonella deserti]